jgi:FixJ family two-component response regulator
LFAASIEIRPKVAGLNSQRAIWNERRDRNEFDVGPPIQQCCEQCGDVKIQFAIPSVLVARFDRVGSTIFQPSSVRYQDIVHSMLQILEPGAASNRRVIPVSTRIREMSLAVVCERETQPFAATCSSPEVRIVPTVFVIVKGMPLREALESEVRRSGWNAETFKSTDVFLSRPTVFGPSCLVLDVTLRGLKGLDLQRRIAADRPGMPVILITTSGDVLMTVRPANEGVAEFVTAPVGNDGLAGTIRRSIEWSEFALRREADVRALRDRHELLSRREREVMAYVVAGLLNKQIAGELGLSEITVKAHRGKVMRKMKARSLADLVRKAECLGLGPRADSSVGATS